MRTLALCLGNTSLFGGVFAGGRLTASFRRPTKDFSHMARRARGKIDAVALCSVVPRQTARLVRHVAREFGVVPQVLTATAPHGLKIAYRDPRQLGTDRLAAALGARKLFPRRNVIIVDCGTATTVTALRRDGALLGGAILPGLALWPEMLATRTAQLPRVPLTRPRVALGRSPREAIASGIYFGHVGAIREVVARVRAEAFGRAPVLVIGTGGNAAAVAREKIFSRIQPALVLHGLQALAAGLTACA